MGEVCLSGVKEEVIDDKDPVNKNYKKRVSTRNGVGSRLDHKILLII
jgi:hypothetical protein